jgi:hypothetical protein
MVDAHTLNCCARNSVCLRNRHVNHWSARPGPSPGIVSILIVRSEATVKFFVEGTISCPGRYDFDLPVSRSFDYPNFALQRANAYKSLLPLLPPISRDALWPGGCQGCVNRGSVLCRCLVAPGRSRLYVVALILAQRKKDPRKLDAIRAPGWWFARTGGVHVRGYSNSRCPC